MKYIKLFENYRFNVIDEIRDILLPLDDESIEYRVINPAEIAIDMFFIRIKDESKLIDSTISHLLNYMTSVGYKVEVSEGAIQGGSNYYPGTNINRVFKPNSFHTNLVFYKETNQGDDIMNYLSKLLHHLTKRYITDRGSYFYENLDLDDMEKHAFEYKEGEVYYDNDFFYEIMVDKFHISRQTLELFLRYLLVRDLKLNVLSITWT